jgi:hypothetical protein
MSSSSHCLDNMSHTGPGTHAWRTIYTPRFSLRDLITISIIMSTAVTLLAVTMAPAFAKPQTTALPNMCQNIKYVETDKDREWYAKDDIYYHVASRHYNVLKAKLKPKSLKSAKPGPVSYLAVAALPTRPRFGEPLDDYKVPNLHRMWGREIVKLLLDAGVDPNAGRPLLTAAYAARKDAKISQDITRQLLNAGADPNTRNDNGWTALMFAAEAGSMDITKQLLKHGARTDYRNCAGQSAADIALKNKHPALARLLAPRP